MGSAISALHYSQLPLGLRALPPLWPLGHNHLHTSGTFLEYSDCNQGSLSPEHSHHHVSTLPEDSALFSIYTLICMCTHLCICSSGYVYLCLHV